MYNYLQNNIYLLMNKPLNLHQFKICKNKTNVLKNYHFI